MEIETLYLPLFAACVITGYLAYKSNQTDDKSNKYDFTQLVIVFAITFSVVLGFTKMVMDTNDDTQMMNNIKSGDPPF